MKRKDELVSKMLLIGALKNHPLMKNWNQRMHTLAPVFASKFILVEQHFAFIVCQLFDFIQDVQNAHRDYIFPMNYSRYYRKSDWSSMPVPLDYGVLVLPQIGNCTWSTDLPAGIHEHSLLFFTLIECPERYFVLFKPDVQIDKDKVSHGLYATGGTKIVKLHGLLFVFHNFRGSDDCSIESIQEIVTFTRPKIIAENSSKNIELRNLVSKQPDEFMNWKKLSFKKHSSDPEPILLLYQNHEGEAVRNFKLNNCSTPQQRLYACLTFLLSIKDLLKSGYWPVDLKYENMCQKHTSTPLCAVTTLTIIDFFAPASTYSLYKRGAASEHVLMVPINLAQHMTLLYRLNYRGCRINGHTIIAPSDRSFGYLVRQLMFEILVNLINIVYQTFLSMKIFACFDQFFPANYQKSWTARNYQKFYFCRDLHHCIYNEFDENKYPLMYWVYYWKNIKNSIDQIYSQECNPHLEIGIDPILGDLYKKLFDDTASQEWFDLLLTLRNTPSPFINEKNPIVDLMSI